MRRLGSGSGDVSVAEPWADRMAHTLHSKGDDAYGVRNGHEHRVGFQRHTRVEHVGLKLAALLVVVRCAPLWKTRNRITAEVAHPQQTNRDRRKTQTFTPREATASKTERTCTSKLEKTPTFTHNKWQRKSCNRSGHGLENVLGSRRLWSS